MQFFTLYKFHATAHFWIVDKTSLGLPLVTFPDGEYPVTFQSPKIGDERFLQYPSLRLSTFFNLDVMAVVSVSVEVASGL
jgi:predicted lipase